MLELWPWFCIETDVEPSLLAAVDNSIVILLSHDVLLSLTETP
jgi:hypothetical protein